MMRVQARLRLHTPTRARSARRSGRRCSGVRSSRRGRTRQPARRVGVRGARQQAREVARGHDAVVHYCDVREAFDDELLSTLEAASKEQSTHDRAHAGRRSGTRCAQGAAPAVDALFRQRMAVIHRDNRNDKAAIARCARRSSSAANAAVARRSRRDGEGQGTTAQLLDALRRLAMSMAATSMRSSVPPTWRRSSASASRRCRSVGRARSRDRSVAWHRGDSLGALRRSMPQVGDRRPRRAYRTGGARAAVDTLVEAARLPFDATDAPRDAHARGTARDVRSSATTRLRSTCIAACSLRSRTTWK